VILQALVAEEIRSWDVAEISKADESLDPPNRSRVRPSRNGNSTNSMHHHEIPSVIFNLLLYIEIFAERRDSFQNVPDIYF